jgi:hypothetical protein
MSLFERVYICGLREGVVLAPYVDELTNGGGAGAGPGGTGGHAAASGLVGYRTLQRALTERIADPEEGDPPASVLAHQVACMPERGLREFLQERGTPFSTGHVYTCDLIRAVYTPGRPGSTPSSPPGGRTAGGRAGATSCSRRSHSRSSMSSCTWSA